LQPAVRILFLHPNFPGQFKHLAAALAREGHDVAFLCQTHYGRTLPGVKRLCMKGNLGHGALQEKAGNQLQRAQTVATQFRRAMAQLEQDQWRPDVVVSHSGWGCGLHVKELWPQCRHVSYLEWWFDPRSDLLHHDPGNQALGLGPQMAPSFWLRNQPLALELTCADAVVAPSQWQRAQLPPLLRRSCEVIFDGIDLKRFRPDPKRRSPVPLLTYGTRGMEPMRGFPELIRELPQVLEQWPTLQVEIAGEDGIHYCGKPPREGSWKTWAQQRLTEYEKSGRLRWVGHLAEPAYVAWLQSSWCHVYLSQPFVASWSLVEALACGCPLVASNVAPVREFCGPEQAWLVDSRQPGFLANPVRHALTGTSPPPSSPEAWAALSQTSALEHWTRVLGVEVATQS
jgi:glycosyltransferase involved in cell wall biosynthesis